MTKMIVWAKWVDPIGRNRDQIEYVPEKDVQEFDNDKNTVYIDEDEDEDDIDSPTPVIVTPLGIVALKPFNDPTKVFNFWLGETNFDITPKVVRIINDIPGVEIFDVFTRYKFRIAVGNNFKFQSVRQDIEKSLDAIPQSRKNITENMPLDNTTKAQIQNIIQLRLINFSYWAIYVFPNGQIDMAAANEKNEEFEERLKLYKDTQSLVGGSIFKHDEEFV